MHSVDLLLFIFFNPGFLTFDLATLSVLSYNFALRHLCHFSHYLPFSANQIAAVVCNSLLGSLLRPPPSQILYRSASVTQWVDLNKYGSNRNGTTVIKRAVNSIYHQYEHYSIITVSKNGSKYVHGDKSQVNLKDKCVGFSGILR